MIRRPPRSTLFPYTRSSDLCSHRGGEMERRAVISHEQHRPTNQYRGLSQRKTPAGIDRPTPCAPDRLHDRLPERRVRSEEHTSELQSQFHLVCRLLPEKKKQ